MESLQSFSLRTGKSAYNFESGKLKVSYDSGVKSTHDIPKDWGFTRIMQFIESIDSAV